MLCMRLPAEHVMTTPIRSVPRYEREAKVTLDGFTLQGPCQTHVPERDQRLILDPGIGQLAGFHPSLPD